MAINNTLPTNGLYSGLSQIASGLIPSPQTSLSGYTAPASGTTAQGTGGALMSVQPNTSPLMSTNASAPATSVASPAYTGTSIVDYLGSKGQASDFTSRSKLATQYGISGYTGTADQNTSLLKLLQGSSAPTPATSNTQQPLYTPTSTAVTPPATTQTAPQTTSVPPTSQAAPTGQTAGLASNVINPQLNATIQALIKAAQSSSPQQAQAQTDLTAAIERERQLSTNYADQTANIKNAGTDLTLQTGQQQNLSQQYAGREAAAQSAITQQQAALGQAQTQQTQQLGALTSAAGLQTPSSQLTQVSPGNYLADASGNAAGGGQAAGIKNATNWAIAQQNMQQGQDYQGQAQAISNALQTIAPVQQSIVPFMAANNLDSNGVPFVNQQINKINAQANPAAYATMEAAISEARSYAIQLLGSQSGANPTDVTSSVNSFDFSNFTPAQLNTFLNNLSLLGQYRLSQAQSASQAGYNANNTVGTPAQGADATGGSLQSGGANSLNNLPDPVKALLGGAISITSDTLKALSNAASGTVGAAAGTGLAAKVLGI